MAAVETVAYATQEPTPSLATLECSRCIALSGQLSSPLSLGRLARPSGAWQTYATVARRM